MVDRYTMFYALYPIGIGAEWWIMYLASGEAEAVGKVVLWVCLGIYVPGEFQLEPQFEFGFW